MPWLSVAADKVAGMARIAVIGAGMGAMAAAARLAVAGHRVAVYERTETYGGAVRRFERDGFAFDTGPGLLHAARGLPRPVRQDRQGAAGGVRRAGPGRPVRHGTSSRTARRCPCRTPRARASVAALDEALGRGRGRALGRLPGPGPRGLGPHPPAAPGGAPVAQLVGAGRARALSGGPAQAAAAHPARHHARRGRRLGAARSRGSRPCWTATRSRTASIRGHAPASAAVLPYMEHAFGTWYVRGGMRELARAVYERCLASAGSSSTSAPR